MDGQLIQQFPRTKCKYPAVPGVCPLSQKSNRLIQWRFFDKAINGKPALHGLSAPDVSISDLGTVRRDSQRHKPVLSSQFSGCARSADEGILVPNEMIARANQHDRRGIKAGSGKRNRRCSVACRWFYNQRAIPELARLLLDKADMRLTRHDQRAGEY